MKDVSKWKTSMVGIETYPKYNKRSGNYRNNYIHSTAYCNDYRKDSWNISVWNVYNMLIDDFRVNKEEGVCVLRKISSNDVN